MSIQRSRGVELTDEVLDGLADRAAEGFDIEQLRPRPRGRPPLGASAGRPLNVRIQPALHDRLAAAASASGRTRSEIVRELLDRHLDRLDDRSPAA